MENGGRMERGMEGERRGNGGALLSCSSNEVPYVCRQYIEGESCRREIVAMPHQN